MKSGEFKYKKKDKDGKKIVISEEADDLMKRLMCVDPLKR